MIWPKMQYKENAQKYAESKERLHLIARAMDYYYLEYGRYAQFGDDWSTFATDENPLVLAEFLMAGGNWKTDAWDRPYIIKKAAEDGFIFQGLNAPGKFQESFGLYGIDKDIQILSGADLENITLTLDPDPDEFDDEFEDEDELPADDETEESDTPPAN